MSDYQQSVWALENGVGLRGWLEEVVSSIHVRRIRCATFSVGVPGLLWLADLALRCGAELQILSDEGQTNPHIVPPSLRSLLDDGLLEWRTVPVLPGPSLDREGWFHPKILILDDRAAVVGSANLTSCGLGLSIPPHHTEMSVGLRGPGAQAAIEKLLQTFAQWWQKSRPLGSAESGNQSQHGDEVRMNQTPEYVVFRNRPAWGIAQVQSVGAGMFGRAQWLAISDISPSDVERLPAYVQVHQPAVERAGPVPWISPAARLAAHGLPTGGATREHFSRLCAYWLQAENRQGQLDNIPVLALRHQASLVEYLTRHDAPRRMLIGDEVGLGKTVEIGLLIERLQAANPGVRILYITPGSLVTNVADEFSNMGLDRFYVFGNVMLDEDRYRHARLGEADADPRVVASLHRLSFGERWENRLQGTKWDVVVIDECHRLRMYGAYEDTKAQKWFRVVERVLNSHLAEGGRVYFLSGTPHQGNPDVFLNLSGLLCGLSRGASPHEKRRALSGRVIYRIKEEIRDWDDLPLFPTRDIRDPTFAATPSAYNTLLSQVAEYFDWLLSEGVHLPGNARRAIGFVKSHALQYAASSPKAGFAYLLRRYLRNFADEGNRNRMEGWASLLVPYRNRTAREHPADLLEYLIKTVSEEEEEDPEDAESGSLTEAVGPRTEGETRQEEKRRLGQMLDDYARLLRTPDMEGKFQILESLLAEADEPHLVFAQSVDTVYAIKRFLEQKGISCAIIVGGQDPADRKKQMEDFRSSGRMGRRVLVSSSAGGEGINLQVARRLIHFDLPWNPMVLEQRIGRIHRIGTIDTVIVHTILLQGSREADIYQRLIDRLNAIVGALAQSPEQRAQYFRRILAGIPLEDLRALFSGQREDDDAIAAAVEAGKQAVNQVDEELQKHRVQLTTTEQGRATMEKLVRLLLASDKIRRIRKEVKYTRIKFDRETQGFIAQEISCPCYRIIHGEADGGIDWVVFDREAAAKSSEVTRGTMRDRTGGINHPLIALALATLRTPTDVDDSHRLTVGFGKYDAQHLQLPGGGNAEPVLLLTYLTAYLSGQQFFNQRLKIFAVSPSQRTPVEITSEGELIEDIFWSHLDDIGDAPTGMPNLSNDFLQHVAAQDVVLRKQLEAGVKDDRGDWQGAVWPLAVTVLTPAGS